MNKYNSLLSNESRLEPDDRTIISKEILSFLLGRHIELNALENFNVYTWEYYDDAMNSIDNKEDNE